ncbi:MSC_0621 family F1-like ATPase epsilon subunit [Mycoplasma capricolum]|uniref:MSC_0621 family F1-like ATPase epsilon subunit n=1 Tax=Mycoplasma capricolum TaxID=2095 RepID=UPI003DA36AF0
MAFSVEINFIENKQTINFKKAIVYFNADEENEWISLTNNSILGYEIMLLKILDLSNNQEKYLFVNNVNIMVKNNHIVINTFSKQNFLVKTNRKKKYQEQLKELHKQITILQANQTIGLTIDSLLELKRLKNKYYVLKLKNLLQLKGE